MKSPTSFHGLDSKRFSIDCQKLFSDICIHQLSGRSVLFLRVLRSTRQQSGVKLCLTSAESDEEALKVIKRHLRNMNLSRHIYLPTVCTL